MIVGRIQTAPTGCRGFDCNQPVTALVAHSFRDAGYCFALRYVPRVVARTNDLSAGEAQNILNAGLALMCVQHVEQGEWVPSAQKGTSYGTTAGEYVKSLGLPASTMIWLDLESVDTHVSGMQTITYCNNWHAMVKKAGFTPGLYVGWQCGLTPQELYSALAFQHYWSAYNLNRDRHPAVRGVCMMQSQYPGKDAAPAIPFAYGVDVIQSDALGGLPTLFTPDEWAP
jgi:hypothetical protein